MPLHPASAAPAARHYDRVTRILHWLMAVQIIIQFLLTLLWSRVGDDLAGELVRLHVSLGVCLVATLLFRILWRLVWGRRLPTTLPRLQATAAHAVHSLLYVMMIIEVATGLSKRWVRGRSVDVFGLIHIPSPFVYAPDLRPIMSMTHEYLAWAIIIVACGHGLVALGHRVWLRDGVLERMTG
jgi:cytochrome b561